MDILFNGDRMEEDKRCEVVGRESAMKNIHIDSNSKEGKLLVEVVNKESTMDKLKEDMWYESYIFFYLLSRSKENFYFSSKKSFDMVWLG